MRGAGKLPSAVTAQIVGTRGPATVDRYGHHDQQARQLVPKPKLELAQAGIPIPVAIPFKNAGLLGTQ
jgi:hypothetical protein